MKKISFSLLFIAISLFACKSEKEKQYDELIKVEKSLFGDRTQFNDSLARVYLGLADAYVKANKGDVHNPDILFKQAEILNGLQSYLYAIRKFQEVTVYTTHPKAAESTFLIGFIYDTYLHNYDEAGRYYRQFLRKYPRHEFAKDAKISLDNLGKSPEDLVKEFEAKNKDSVNIQ